MRHMVYFDQLLRTYVCNTVSSLACVMAFLMDEALLSISPAGCGQYGKSS